MRSSTEEAPESGDSLGGVTGSGVGTSLGGGAGPPPRRRWAGQRLRCAECEKLDHQGTAGLEWWGLTGGERAQAAMGSDAK